MKINTVTIIGANGTMGRNVAAIYASFGNCKVNLVCRNIEKAKDTIKKSVESVRADCIASRLIPHDFSSLEECVKESDLILEQIREELDDKISIFKRISLSLKPSTIVCTGTSGLSVTTLSEYMPYDFRKNFYGIHMFNPPYMMTLCELIPTKYSDEITTQELKNYLSNVLLRTVIVVKDRPGFLANRIGFQFINEALLYAEKYKDYGGIDYIDAILGPFSGRSMSPITTADFVGIDVHKAIVDNIYVNTNDYSHDTFVCPQYVISLLDEGKLGKKVGCGLYFTKKFDNVTKQLYVYDISSKNYREVNKYVFPFIESMIANLKIGSYKEAFQILINNHSTEAEICLHFLLSYVMYSILVAEEVGFSVHDADDAMATGFNWCPPLALVDALSKVVSFKDLIKERLILEKVDVDHLLSLIEPSKYDYRIYFKAKK